MRQRRPWPRRFNFEAPYNRKEAMGALVAQGIIQLFLLIALIILFIVSLRMMASPAFENLRFWARILPIVIALITLLLLRRFLLFFRAVLEEHRAAKEAQDED